jgi:methyl-accepting chemotaxis protein
MSEKEQRRSKRQALHYRAQIEAVGDEAALDCTIRDVSETGARVATKAPDQVPEQFILRLTKDGATRRLCKVVWRSDREVGVSFVRPPRQVKITEMGVAVDPTQ